VSGSSLVYETNVFGLLNVTRAVLPHMRAACSGHVINLSSVGGYQSGPGFGVYCSTKFAVEGLSEALHAELAPLGVKVTIVEPGYFRTEFLEGNSLVESPASIVDYDSTAGEVRKIAKAVTLNQPGDPDKLAQAMITLVEAEKPRCAYRWAVIVSRRSKPRIALSPQSCRPGASCRCPPTSKPRRAKRGCPLPHAPGGLGRKKTRRSGLKCLHEVTDQHYAPVC
jgi:short-subunit dehydrogenase